MVTVRYANESGAVQLGLVVYASWCKNRVAVDIDSAEIAVGSFSLASLQIGYQF